MDNLAPELNSLQHRASTAEVRTDEAGRRVFTALAYDTTAVDRHGTTMTSDALQLAPGGAPVLLFHKGDTFPVGKVLGMSAGPRGPEVEFVLTDATEEARTAAVLVETGFLRGVSVGFIPMTAEVREADGVIVYTSAELVELSLTPIPSSRLALVDLKRSVDDLVAQLPADEPVVEAPEVVEEPVVETVEEAVEEVADPDVAPAEEAATVEDEVRSVSADRLARIRRLGA